MPDVGVIADAIDESTVFCSERARKIYARLHNVSRDFPNGNPSFQMKSERLHGNVRGLLINS